MGASEQNDRAKKGDEIIYEHDNQRRENKTGFQSKGPVPGRLWPERNFDRGKGNARVDGDPRKIRTAKTARRRADHGVAPHDNPDRGLDRNTGRSWRKRALGFL